MAKTPVAWWKQPMPRPIARFFRPVFFALFALGSLTARPAEEAKKEGGAVLFEGENLVVLKHAGRTQPQEMRPFGEGGWSGNAQLWWAGAKPGDALEVALPVAAAGTYRIGAGLTKAPDYGIFDIALDGKKIAGPLDFYNETVAHSGMTAPARIPRRGMGASTCRIRSLEPSTPSRWSRPKMACSLSKKRATS